MTTFKKKNLILFAGKLVFIVLALSLELGATKLYAQAPATFTHPGAMNNKADLDFVKARIAAGEQPWLAKFNQMLTLATAYNATTAPQDGNENGQKADARQCYANALAWYYTGNTTYAQNAIKILNVWGNTFNGYAVPPVGQGNQSQLNAGWTGALLGPAAEIMRGYSGWVSTDMATVQNMFKTKFYPALNQMSSWNGNVDLTQIDAMMNIAVFCEDATEFNLGIQRLNKRNPAYFYLSTDLASSRVITGDGNNTNNFWSNPTNWVNGLTQETCRDNGHHAQYALASALHAAEVAWNQGVDLYTPNEQRYTAALELMATQIQTGQMQGTCSNNTTTPDLYDTWEVGYNHYHNRMGLSLPNTLTVITNKIRPSGQSDWNIFFETLTHANVSVTLGIEEEQLYSYSTKDSKSKEIVLFPNPSVTGFTIQSSVPVEVKVMDNLGRIVSEFSLTDTRSFGEEYLSGVYHASITDAKGLLKIIKLVKGN